MNPVTFKRRENEIGLAVEQVAKKSCKTAAMSEEKCCHQKGCKINADDQGCINIPYSDDMGWKKRGKGHNSSPVMLQSYWV